MSVEGIWSSASAEKGRARQVNSSKARRLIYGHSIYVDPAYRQAVREASFLGGPQGGCTAGLGDLPELVGMSGALRIAGPQHLEAQSAAVQEPGTGDAAGTFPRFFRIQHQGRLAAGHGQID